MAFNSKRLHFSLVKAFADRAAALGVTPPSSIARALTLMEALEDHTREPTGPVLDMTPEQAKERLTEISIRRHDRNGKATERGMNAGLETFRDQLADEARAAALPELDELVSSLQDRFSELAAPLELAAQKYGFTSQTTSDQVIELADEGASAAWRGARKAWSEISAIVALRIEISKVFNVSPTREDMSWQVFPQVLGASPVNFSAAFARGENWSGAGGYYLEGKTGGHLDWLALAAGGLRLNTPTETAAKIAARPNRLGAVATLPKSELDFPRPVYR